MTPGNHPIIVKIKLIRNSVPKPCFRKTAKGGSRIHKITVSIDIILFFWFNSKLGRITTKPYR